MVSQGCSAPLASCLRADRVCTIINMDCVEVCQSSIFLYPLTQIRFGLTLPDYLMTFAASRGIDRHDLGQLRFNLLLRAHAARSLTGEEQVPSLRSPPLVSSLIPSFSHYRSRHCDRK